ncbi:hypothetical protein VTK73DRAFT_5533, partial [Phialemonium thermophilum]
LKRIRREREAIEAREREREEVERRRNLTEEERRAEDEEFLARQRAEKEGRGRMAYMQKYFHKGAFYQDESRAQGLDKRDIMGMRIADDVRNRELLPKYMQIRDMTKLGRKGATKYRDLKSEDTGRWGELDPPPRSGGGYHDGDRDRYRGDGAKGANAIPLGDRKSVPPDGAPDRPRSDRYGEGGGYRDRRRDDERGDRDDRRQRRRSRSRSPRRDYGDRDDRYDERGSEYRDWRKREPSRERDRYESDKRRRVDAR